MISNAGVFKEISTLDISNINDDNEDNFVGRTKTYGSGKHHFDPRRSYPTR